tara:strand:+ start:1637 stop:2578 length:942 start_codon:yes stop_codon:yes gene_type:complete
MTNADQEELNSEEIDIEIVDDSPEGSGAPVSPEDELENYTKSVSKRINKLNAKNKETEQRAAQLEQIAMQKEQELQQYRALTSQQSNTVLAKEAEAVKAKTAQIDEVYRQAVRSGDADLMSKATDLKNEIAIQQERLRVAQARQPKQQQAPQADSGQYQTYQQQPQAPQQQQEVTPTTEALSWHEKNSWYGDKENEENLQATQFAYFTHFNLLNEGFDADSDEYYGALDNRVKKVYPNLVGNAETTGQKPAVQRVSSSTAPSGRQQTRKNSGVTFSNSEVERLAGLKPANMTMDVWLKHVAKEKQKISAKENR